MAREIVAVCKQVRDNNFDMVKIGTHGKYKYEQSHSIYNVGKREKKGNQKSEVCQIF